MAVKLQPRQIPQNPGVYFFKGASGTILYIGKASNLRARLSSYFQNSKNMPSKTKLLVAEAVKADWEILNSEIEALIKEAELIKKYHPKYNVLMRDDKNYLYVAFTRSTSSGQAEKYPRIFLTHQPNANLDYIGPFTEVGPIKTTLKMLRRTFPYCTCKAPHKRPCLNAKLGRCPGFCCSLDQNLAFKNRLALPRNKSELNSAARAHTYDFSLQDSGLYNKNISAIKKILSGKNKKLTQELKREMKVFSKAQKYEEAGKVRDQIWALKRIFEHRGVIKQEITSENQKALRALETILKIENIGRIEAYDIANIGGEFAYGSMAVFDGGKIKKEDYRIFKIRGVSGSNDPAMIREVLSRRLRHQEWPFPQVIIIDGGKPQLNAAKMAENLAFKIIALTKNKKHVGDHIFISGQSNPMPLDRLPSPAKNLILQLDSEAHRFAISYYRKRHGKAILT